MALDTKTLGNAARPASQLCRAQLENFTAALGEFASVTVACTQEAAVFSEVAEQTGYGGTLRFANIRETAGWSEDGDSAAPKMAAILAMAEQDVTPFEIVSMESDGVALILGRDQVALETAAALANTLDLTVLLQPGSDVMPPRRTTWPVLQGRVGRAKGHLGTYELTIDAYAVPDPSSRRKLEFGAARDGATSRCDLIIDLTGGTPLFHHSRPGYLRADPADAVGVAKLITQAAEMVGTFDKPKFINFTPDLCAHSRNTLTGCTRCLDLCPTGAILSAGDTVAIDPNICAGCGQCAAACPTGAASYALPVVDNIVQRLRAGLRAYHDAGAKVAPVILLHDEDHGGALIDASARFGRGLPAHVIPLGVNEVTQIGPEVVAAALAYGAAEVCILTPARPAHPLDGVEATQALLDEIGTATKRGATLRLVQTDDPDALDTALWHKPGPVQPTRASFLPPEDKRGLLVLAVEEMIRTAPAPQSEIALPKGAPFGTVELDLDSCTLCLACVGACPAGALLDNPDLPMLRFNESACVQCGLCVATCPETALSLTPRISLDGWETPRRVLKEEEPFPCTSCGKPFGTKSSIDRVMAKLDSHWMFTGAEGSKRLRLLSMCDDCRTKEVVIAGFDPHEPSA